MSEQDKEAEIKADLIGLATKHGYQHATLVMAKDADADEVYVLSGSEEGFVEELSEDDPHPISAGSVSAFMLMAAAWGTLKENGFDPAKGFLAYMSATAKRGVH